ncbi:MAG: helix-turn-helix domain-containing protein [Phycisphaerae bacterium]|nr:helix-turn-helix domain-containing protein [Phycisphaerae bacterium]
MQENNKLTIETVWPERPQQFPPVMTPTEAAQFLRLDQISHTPKSAKRTLDYWRDHGELKGTKYARHVWYLKSELEAFLHNKTEE